MLIRELRQAARALAANRGFALVAVLTLALGIGATSTMFSVVNTVLLQPLPYRDPSSIAMIWSQWRSFDKTWVSETEVHDYRTQTQSFEAIGAWSSGNVNVTGGAGDPERVPTASVTANLFEVLGVQPSLGRYFTAEEDAPNRTDTVIVAHGLWTRRLGSDPSVIGRSIEIDGRQRTIVGVMPEGFRLPLDFQDQIADQLWMPLGVAFTADADARGSHYLYVAGRLAPGRTAADASAELDALTARMTADGMYPVAMQFKAFALSVPDEVFGRIRPALILVLAAVGFLLLITCANVMNLQLTRAESRRREVAIRSALGAGTLALVRSQLAESLLLALVGGALGVIVASFGAALLARFSAAGIPRLMETRIDTSVLLFTLLVALTTAAIFGLAPLVHTGSGELGEVLKAGTRGAAGVVRKRLRNALVIGQMAMAMVLVIGAGLMLKSLWSLQRVDVGFNPSNVLTAQISLPETRYPSPESVVSFYARLLSNVRTLPGVEHAGFVRSLPLASPIGDWGLDIEGFVETPGREAKGDWQIATSGYFEAMGERIRRGRWFTDQDRTESPQVAVINDTMARTYWPGDDPIGKRIKMGSSDPNRPWVTVIGIVEDVKHNELTGIIKEKFYRPHSQFHLSTGNPIRGMTLVMRTAGDPTSLIAAIRRETAAVDPGVPVSNVRTMSEVLEAVTAGPRLTGWLMGIFAGLALTLAAIGLYGVLAYLVSRRTREVGIHMALGATIAQVRTMIIGQGLRLAAAGIVIGTLAAVALTRVMSTLLYGVTATDPATFVAVPVVLAAVSVLASYMPARRATKVNPMVALRDE